MRYRQAVVLCGIDHGICPVPTPGTAEILKGIPLAAVPLDAELTTPTGAAIVKVLADSVWTVTGADDRGDWLWLRNDDLLRSERMCCGFLWGRRLLPCSRKR
ncbi:MAG UNVERIFIED_CONTAM: DUF111 family protein [Planctomycetaceae bacterium]|jgi:hypothetical protein